MGDVLFFDAPDLVDAQEQFTALCGRGVPASLLSWTKLQSLPAGEEYAADCR
jgi:hypothetical protein